MTAAPDHIRILRAAEHWARGVSKTFDAEVADCAGSLALATTEDGAIVLQGRNTAGHPVSICLAHGQDGPEIHLLRTELITADGFAAIRKTEVQLSLPRYLRRQLAPTAEVSA